MGRPDDEPDPGRPRGQGPALPVHRRHAVALVPRGGADPPPRISGRGGGPGLAVALGDAGARPLGAARRPRVGRHGAVRGDPHGASVHRGIDPGRGAQDRPQAPPPADRVHRRPAGRGGHQRGRGRPVRANLPRPAPGPGRPAGPRARDPPDRPRRRGADPPRQPLAQADEPHATVRRPARRDDDRTRPAPAPADPAHGSRAGRLCPRRHGAVRAQGPDLRHLPLRAHGARLPRLGRRRDRGAGLPARDRGGLAVPRRVGRGARDAGHGAAGQGGVLGLRGPACPPDRLARPGLPPEVGDRRELRAVCPVPDGAPAPAPPRAREPQRPEPGARDGRRRGVRRPGGRVRGADAPRHGRVDPAGDGRARAAGQGLYALRGDAAGHGLPGAPAPGKHVQRVILESNVRRGCPGRRPAAGPRGGGSHVGPDETPRRCAERGRAAGRLATLPQRAADRLHPARGPRGDACGARGSPGAVRAILSAQAGRSHDRGRGGVRLDRPGRLRGGGGSVPTRGGGAGRPGRLVGPRGVRLVVADPAGRARGGAPPGRRDHEATSVLPGGLGGP